MLKAEYLMRRQGFTQTELSSASGVHRTIISRVLNGGLPAYPKWRDAIAEALGWEGDPAELFEEIEVL